MKYHDISQKSAYHASSKLFSKFSTQQGAIVDKKLIDKPLFFTTDKEYAIRMAAPVLYKVKLNINKTFDAINKIYDGAGNLTEIGNEISSSLSKLIPNYQEDDHEEYLWYLNTGSWDIMELSGMIQWIKDKGYDSFFVLEEPHINIGVFDPSKVTITNTFIVDGTTGSNAGEFKSMPKTKPNNID